MKPLIHENAKEHWNWVEKSVISKNYVYFLFAHFFLWQFWEQTKMLFHVIKIFKQELRKAYFMCLGDKFGRLISKLVDIHCATYRWSLRYLPLVMKIGQRNFDIFHQLDCQKLDDGVSQAKPSLEASSPNFASNIKRINLHSPITHQITIVLGWFQGK